MAAKAKKNVGGRPSKYSKYYAPRMAELMSAAGMIDKEMADELGIAESTFHKWKKDHPEFSDAIAKGKEKPNRLVESALIKSALGHNGDDVTQYRDADGNITGTVMHRRYIPPSTGAMVFFLKNRIPDRWKDKQDLGLAFEEDPLAQFAEAMKGFQLGRDSGTGE